MRLYISSKIKNISQINKQYAVSAEHLLAFPARFRVSYQVSAQAAFEGIQVPLDLSLIRYPLWGEVDSTLLMIRAPVLLLRITEMGWLSLRKLMIAKTAIRQEQAGLIPLLIGEGAVKFVFLEVFIIERGCASSFMVLA